MPTHIYINMNAENLDLQQNQRIHFYHYPGRHTNRDLLNRNMLQIPFAIDPLSRFRPLLQNFLVGNHPAPLLQFPPSRPNVTQMYTKLLQNTSPKGILLLANHNWLLHPTQRFYGHSYLAPTPSIATVLRGSGPFVPSIFFILAGCSFFCLVLAEMQSDANTKKQTDAKKIEYGFLPR